MGMQQKSCCHRRHAADDNAHDNAQQQSIHDYVLSVEEAQPMAAERTTSRLYTTGTAPHPPSWLTPAPAPAPALATAPAPYHSVSACTRACVCARIRARVRKKPTFCSRHLLETTIGRKHAKRKHATDHMQQRTVQQTMCNRQIAAGNIEKTTWSTQHAADNIQGESSSRQSAADNVRRTTSSRQRAAAQTPSSRQP